MTAHHHASESHHHARIGYLVSRFPKISETFILYEILELERNGMHIEIYPLVRESEAVSHPEAERLAANVRHVPLVSRSMLAAQLYWLRHHPRRYAGAWWRAILGNVRSPKFLLRAFAVVPTAAWVARDATRRGITHFHAHWATHPALAAYVIQQLTGIRYSLTVHAHDIYVDRTMLGEKLRHASAVVTISDFNRRLLEGDFGADAGGKIRVIRCGVDSSVFVPPTPAAVPRATLTIVCTASLEDYKGHVYLVRAIAQLKASGHPVECLLIGDGELRPRLERIVSEQGLQGDIQFLGPQPRDRVAALVRTADLVVLPSVITRSGKMDGIPVALMEALAAGRPVVATAISGIPELVIDGETGLLVPQRDSRALADAILRLSGDKSLARRLGDAGRQLVMDEFDLARNAKKLSDLLLDLTRR